MPHNQFNNLKNITLPQGEKMKFYSLHALERMGFGKISRLTSLYPHCPGNQLYVIMMIKKLLLRM